MMSKVISTFWSNDNYKKALVCVDVNSQCYFVECYDVHLSGLKIVDSISFPGKSLHYAESAASNFTTGILNVSETA
jgi:hypothetical protein